ncbi:hypothetical protein ACLKA7_014953 [Drosophila subpalustris]
MTFCYQLRKEQSIPLQTCPQLPIPPHTTHVAQSSPLHLPSDSLWLVAWPGSGSASGLDADADVDADAQVFTPDPELKLDLKLKLMPQLRL